MTAGRLIRIAIAVVAIWIGLFLVGYWVFGSDGSGEAVELVTTP